MGRPTSYEEALAQHALGGAGALQHRRRRLRQAPGGQARDDPRGLPRQRPRGPLGRAAGRVEPLRARAARARRREGRPRRDAAPADARDRRGVLRHVQVRGDPALDVGALRRRGHPPPGVGLRREGARHRPGERRPHRPGARRARAADRGPPGGGRRPRSRPRTRSPTTPPSSTTPPARPGSRRASCTRTATCSRTRSSSTATTCRTASSSTAWASGRGPPGIAPLFGPVAARRRAARLPARGRLRPAQAARRALAPRRDERVHDADGDALDDGDHRRGHPLPAEVPRRLQRGRAAQPGGDPLVPRAVRPHGARLLRAHRVLSARRQLPVHGRPRGLDGPADAGLGRRRSSTRTSGRSRRASAARSACARARTRTIRSATGTTRRRARRRSAATGSTRRTPPASTRTATSGTRAAPTT